MEKNSSDTQKILAQELYKYEDSKYIINCKYILKKNGSIIFQKNNYKELLYSNENENGNVYEKLELSKHDKEMAYCKTLCYSRLNNEYYILFYISN
jgi:hypothetical protein